MNAIDLLTQDHRTVDKMFEEFQSSKQAPKKRELVDKMIKELSAHAAAEEKELYPIMRKAFSDSDSVEHAEHEHAEAKAILAVLSWLGPENESFDPMVEQIIEDVRHHVKEEEGNLLPKLKEKLSEKELEELGERLEQAKREAPTRPAPQELKALSQEELYEFTQKLGIEGRSKMDKDELISVLSPQ